MSTNNHASFIWSVADLLRSRFKAHQYGDIILPFTVLRRIDCVLEPTKQAVLTAVKEAEADGQPVRAALLKTKAGHSLSFWNTSTFTLKSTLGDPDQLQANLGAYLNGFSDNVADVFVKYKIHERIQELAERDLLFQVVQRFTEDDLDLSPAKVPNEEMGHVFEELIRRFAEASNETAGEHFTPRDVVRLMVDLLLAPDDDALRKPHVLRSVYDPTAGTGGMLSVTEDRVHELNPTAKLQLAGQEINPQSFAICKADMMMKGQPMDAIQYGDTLLDDKHAGHTFNYCLSNPPFGVDWKQQQAAVQAEARDRGLAGRFGAGLPAVSDGAMLFLLHLVSKMRKPEDGQAGGRAAIVLNGSPLFTGGAGSGPSNIRKWLLERDYLEAIVALPTDMFYNTGIATYVWVLSTQKAPGRKGVVQLIDGAKILHKMKKGLGSKRNQLEQEDIDEIVRLYGEFETGERSKLFNTEDFFYRTITVERPLKRLYSVDEVGIEQALAVKSVQKLAGEVQRKLRGGLEALAKADGVEEPPVWRNRADFSKALRIELVARGGALPPAVVLQVADAIGKEGDGDVETDGKGNPVPDPDLRDTENVPWNENPHEYLIREVLPFAPGAWIDEAKTKEGCEVPFTRHFYVYTPPRPLEEIDRDLDEVLGRIRARLEAVRA